jgi:hypothetical protein
MEKNKKSFPKSRRIADFSEYAKRRTLNTIRRDICE